MNGLLDEEVLVCATADIVKDGFTRDVYLINGQQPGPSIEVDEGDDVEVFVQNDLSVETTLHWHGKATPPFRVYPSLLLSCVAC